MREADPVGDRIHMALAMLACAVVASGTVPVEIAFDALAVCLLCRLVKIWREVGTFFQHKLATALVLWVVIMAVSVLWSPDSSQGLQELLRARFALVPLLLYPVIDRASRLIAMILIGVLLLHAAQFAQVIGVSAEWLNSERYDVSRFAGLNHPVVSANLIVCAMALHMSAVFAGRSRVRLVGTAGLLLALVGLILTGSRGPWLAAAIVLPMQVLVIVWRSPAMRRMGLAVAAVVIVVGLIGSIWLAGPISRRVHDAASDLRQVMETGDYRSHTGARVLMFRMAVEMFADRPIVGYGGGSYKIVASAKAEQLLGDSGRGGAGCIHGHAHNMWAHEAATRGMLGLSVTAALFVFGIAAAVRLRRIAHHPWRLGLPWALVAMGVCAIFDHPLITQNNCYMTMLLLACCFMPGDEDNIASGAQRHPPPHRMDSDHHHQLEGSQTCGSG